MFARFGRPQYSSGLGQLLLGEKSCLTVADRDAPPAVDATVVVEKEQADVALLGVAVDVDLVAKRFAGPRKAAVISEVAAQQAIDALAAVLEVGAHPGDQRQVRLACLDHDAGRHHPLVQIP